MLDGHPQKDFTLMGSYRHLIVKPQNILLNSVRQESIVEWLKAEFNEKEKNTKEENWVNLSFDLPSSSYATTLISHISNGNYIIKNKNYSIENERESAEI